MRISSVQYVLHGLNERSGMLLGYVMPDALKHAPLIVASEEGGSLRHGRKRIERIAISGESDPRH
jgi:hypothetical protein